MAIIQDEVSIQSASGKFGVHSQEIYELISKFKSDQQNIVFNKHKKLIENSLQNKITLLDSAILQIYYWTPVIHQMVNEIFILCQGFIGILLPSHCQWIWST